MTIRQSRAELLRMRAQANADGDAVTLTLVKDALDFLDHDEQRRRRRRQLFDADTLWHLEALDRRRAAARRLVPLCDVPHDHPLGCHDPLARPT